jgi:hypothetical protein
MAALTLLRTACSLSHPSSPMTVQDLKDLTPFMAIVVSILALTAGPFISGRVARAQTVAVMREKWIYAFRDCLVELVTEFDVLQEGITEEGIVVDEEYEAIIRKLRTLANRVHLMVHSDEPLYDRLTTNIEGTISLLQQGFNDYEGFHELNDSVKTDAQAAIRMEWKKIPA